MTLNPKKAALVERVTAKAVAALLGAYALGLVIYTFALLTQSSAVNPFIV
ncbi:hypothetical protein [Parvibaculum sp.]